MRRELIIIFFSRDIEENTLLLKNLLSVALIRFSSSKVALRENERVTCGDQNFRCQSGECIPSSMLCDGRADCGDKSDETREECMRPEIICPRYAFRCTYGACIDGDKTCNGVDDCVDRSDELLPTCPSPSSDKTGCTEHQFECNNKECIGSALVCDGRVHCTDRSDETSFLCQNDRSKDNDDSKFRCKYGAYINAVLKCNKVRDCADGSDEDPSICQNGSPTQFESFGRPLGGTKGCSVPNQPTNGHWKLHKIHCDNRNHCDVSSNNVRLEPGTHLVYECSENYKIDGIADVFCSSGAWSHEPKCVEIRCKPLSSEAIRADCAYNNEWISCDVPVPPGTTATLSCRNSYRLVEDLLSPQYNQVQCNSRGEWSRQPIQCTPECGIVSDLRPLCAYCSRSNVSNFPWHATLYKTLPGENRKRFLCGATIIKNDLLITAAHCVNNGPGDSQEDASMFDVVTGNLIRDYDSKFHNMTYVTKAKVKRIYTHCNYLGHPGNYGHDIAILQIDKKFTFSSLLQPACLDLVTSDDSTLVGQIGEVAGFGATENANSSFFLRKLTVPYVPQDKCLESATDSYNPILIRQFDKFCAGYTNGSKVCKGDSGGGLVFETDHKQFLRGIVSTDLPPPTDAIDECNIQSYASYTSVSKHIQWIKNIMGGLDPSNEPPCRGR